VAGRGGDFWRLPVSPGRCVQAAPGALDLAKVMACPDRQVALGRFGLAAQPLGQGQDPAGSGFSYHSPSPSSAGAREAHANALLAPPRWQAA